MIKNSIKNSILKAKIIPSELTYGIRKRVLWPHIKNNNYTLDIDTDNDTFHLGVFMEETIISIGTFVKEKNKKFNIQKQYRLRAMGTDLKYQKIGAGKCLMLKAIELLKEKNTHLLWCSARLKAIPFYQSLNMQTLDKVYNIINIGPHKTMYIYIK